MDEYEKSVEDKLNEPTKHYGCFGALGGIDEKNCKGCPDMTECKAASANVVQDLEDEYDFL